MPGSSPTMLRREPVRRLKSVDLPTLGRPQIAMSGRALAAACSMVTDCWRARSSASRQSASWPSAGAEVMRRRRPPEPLPARSFAACCSEAARKLRPTVGLESSAAMGLRDSKSGERRETRLAAACLAFFAASSLRFFGSTAPMRVAPVVAGDFGARPFLGRVLACRCFLPRRFAAFFAAMGRPLPTHGAPLFIIGRSRLRAALIEGSIPG